MKLSINDKCIAYWRYQYITAEIRNIITLTYNILHVIIATWAINFDVYFKFIIIKLLIIQ